MKNNTMKRVLAATLSVLTVASPMTANVGGFLTGGSAIVANADAVESERVELNWAGTVYDTAKGSTYLTGFKLNGTAQTGLTANDNQKFQSGSRVELTSSVPLAFGFKTGSGEASEKIKDLTITGSEYDGYKYNNDAEAPKFTKADSPDMTPDELAEALLEEAGFDVDTDETFTKLSAWDAGHTTLAVNFYAKETVKDGTYTYTFVMPADNDDDSTGDTLKVATIAQPFAVTYYSSEANRTHKNGNDADPIEWGETGDTTTDGKNALGTDGYFTGLTFTSKNETDTKTVLDTTASELKSQILGDTVTVTCANPFVIHVNDNDDTENWINPEITYDSEKMLFKTTFIMPKSKTAAPVQVDVVKIDEEYTYTANAGKLFATTKSGSIKNAEAVAITAKYYDTEADATAATKGTEVNGTVANGKFVVIDATVSDKLTKNVKNVVIKKGSTILTETPDEDELKKLDADNKYLISEKAGTYTVTYTVTGNDGKDYEVTYSFTIAAKSALTAENVKLAFSIKKDNEVVYDPTHTVTIPKTEDIDENNWPDVMAPGQELDNLSVKTGETATYMIASGKAKVVEKAGYQFTVTPTVYADAEHQTALDPKSYYVEGNPSGSKLGNTYTFTIYITDPEFGGSEAKPKTITMTWEIVDYDEVPQWHDSLWPGAGAKGSIEDIDALEDEIFKAAHPNEAAVAAREAGEVRYQWIEGSGAVRTNELQDELDEWNDGLPTEMGEYTVYIIYKDVVKATVNVSISKYALNILADESDLTYTYGKKFELKKPTIQKNSAGQTVKVNVSDLWCTISQVATNADGEPLMKTYDENGVWTGTKAWDGKSTDFVFVDADKTDYYFKKFGSIEEVGQLPAGYYAIQFGGTADDENYSVSNNTAQLLTVNKKMITDSSIVIIVDPFTYDGTQHDVVKDGNFTVRDTDFEADDAEDRYDISAKFKMTEGGKRTAAGTYDCTFKLVSDDKNYEGTAVDSSWYITHAEADPKKVDAGLTWDEERSTLYDNGRIHVEITRNADDKINKDKTVAKIEKFGVLFDKVGKLAAPEVYGVDYSDEKVESITEAEYKSGKHADNDTPISAAEREKYLAEKMLEYGNKAFGEGGYTKTTSVTCASQTYKANIEVSDVDTGMWLRPYILYEDGTVSYGDIKYLDLTHEAINHLQLQMAELGVNGKATRKADLTAAQTKTLEKTMKYVKSGYNVVENKFYAYTSYVDLETAGFTNVAQVADFGVVVDRNAAIAANADTATVDKALRIGATKGLVVGHYKKDNPVLKENEYAASIKLGNAATGCWVRPYIDLGNGLVIYADPVYIKSASEYYGEAAAGKLATVWENDSYQRLIFTQVEAANTRINAVAQKAGVEVADVEVVKTGVIADKKNLLKKPMVDKEFKDDTNEKNVGTYSVLDTNAPFNTQMVLGAGFIDGKKSSDFGAVYTAKLSPKDTNDVSVRTYTVYNIKGVEVTVYGPVKTFEYSDRDNIKRVVNTKNYDWTGEIAPTDIGFMG